MTNATKLTVFGATGGTGTEVVKQALAAGDEVIAVVRNRSRLAVPAHDGLRVVEADVMDADAIAPLVADRDAVVSALGSHEGRRPTTVCGDGVTSIIKAMEQGRTRRLAVVSASGPFIDDGDGPIIRYVGKPLVQWMLKNGFADLVAMEEKVRGSGLDWTIVRPPRLTNSSRRRRYRTELNRNVRGGARISRADLADFILRALPDPAYVGAAVFIGY
jgi:putative NADH-flavin reductase